jgi:hypothetical protein
MKLSAQHLPSISYKEDLFPPVPRSYAIIYGPIRPLWGDEIHLWIDGDSFNYNYFTLFCCDILVSGFGFQVSGKVDAIGYSEH